MHLAHFYNVPFENLNISRRVPIEVDEGVLFAKVVQRRRGGFCLELTGLFAMALREIGFAVDVIGARVITPASPALPMPDETRPRVAVGQFSYPMSHMTLVVHLDELWIADVGFGGRIAGPLRMAESGVQLIEGREYVVANDGDHWMVTCNEADNPPPLSYLFTTQPRDFSEFTEVCGWLQTSPESRFTQGDMASMATPTGRVTLAGQRLIVADAGERTESVIAEEDVSEVLKERFGLVL
jgi:N-hydroxyarylamine O-acetyltransferase